MKSFLTACHAGGQLNIASENSRELVSAELIDHKKRVAASLSCVILLYLPPLVLL